MTISEPPAAGVAQPQAAGRFEAVVHRGRAYLAFPAGRHAAHAAEAPGLTLVAPVGDALAGEALEARLAALRAATPADGQLVLVAGATAGWTVSLCVGAALADDRVVVYRPTGAVAPGEALGLAAAPLALAVPEAGITASTVTGLRAALDAVAGAGLAAGPDPWFPSGFVYGPEAAAAALQTPPPVLAACPLLLRTALLEGLGAEPWPDLVLDLCARADALGVDDPFATPRPVAPDERSLADRVAAAHRVAERLAVPPTLEAAARGIAAGLTAAPALPAADLRAAAGALAALAEATPPPPRSPLEAALQRVAGPAILEDDASAATVPESVDAMRLAPGAPPLPLGLRAFPFLCMVEHDQLDAAARLVGAYVQAFTPEEPVSLVLRPCFAGAAEVAELERRILAELDALDRSPDAIADLLVELTPLEPRDLPPLYASARCAVVLDTAAARVALEAMACGLPVLGEPGGALAEIVTDATGFPVTGDGLVAALRRAAGDPAGCAARGHAARGLVLDRHSGRAAAAAVAAGQARTAEIIVSSPSPPR